ncbi:MAG: hypothetical protein ACJATO_002070, partial [Arenicella sp.]
FGLLSQAHWKPRFKRGFVFIPLLFFNLENYCD